MTLSGNQVMVYDNCELIHQRVVPLPDYCANDSNLVLSVADSTVQERVQNRMAVSNQLIVVFTFPILNPLTSSIGLCTKQHVRTGSILAFRWS